MTGKQYFFLVVLTIILSVSGGYLIDSMIESFASLRQNLDTVFFMWVVGFLTLFTVFGLYGIVLLFRIPSLKQRVWVWIGIVINLFIVYSFIFADLGY